MWITSRVRTPRPQQARLASFFSRQTKLYPKTIIEVDLSTRQLVEKQPIVPMMGVSGMGTSPPPIVFSHLLTDLYNAAHDPNIVGLSLELGGNQLAFARAQELREIIQLFHAKNKQTFVHAEYYNDWNYYLASSFKHLWMIPEGFVNLSNFERLPQAYVGHLFKEQGIEFPVVRRKQHKLALDNLTEEKMSDEARDQIQRLYLDGIWKQCKEALVADKRFDAEEKVQLLMREGYAYGTELVERKVVDDLLHAASAKNKMLKLVGVSDEVIATRKGRSDHLISYAAYSKQQAQKNKKRRLRVIVDFVKSKLPWINKNVKEEEKIVAVVTLTGGIRSGDSAQGISTLRASKAIKQAMEEPNVAAIVLRIDSGGGSALASASIGDVIVEAKKKGIPVVASMATIAASGGYWISAPCTSILANPGTITGSIGVFSALIKAHDFLTKKMGVKVEYGPGEESPSGHLSSMIAPYTSHHHDIQNRFADHFYNIFLRWVSSNRSEHLPTVESVEPIAQGRVHTGYAAYGHRLVDKLGGYIDALHVAGRLGKILPEVSKEDKDSFLVHPLPKVKHFPAHVSFGEQLMKRFNSPSRNSEDLTSTVDVAGEIEMLSLLSRLGLVDGKELASSSQVGDALAMVEGLRRLLAEVGVDPSVLREVVSVEERGIPSYTASRYERDFTKE